MRVITGKYRGFHILPPIGIKARPTTDFAKENLFNVLNNKISFEGIDVLDLFAGTGSISLEFISRGAKSVTTVEIAHLQQRFITEVCKKLQIDNLHLVHSDVFKFIEVCKVQYEVIFADPPYQMPNIGDMPDIIFEHELLKPEGLFILEHSKAQDFTNHPHFIEERVYGNVHFSLFT